MNKLVMPILIASLLLLATALPARADFVGAPGKIAGFLHNDDNSDDYGVYRGLVSIDEGGGTVQPYRWGGTLCAGRDLSIDQQSLLLQALRSKMRVLPYYLNGQAGVRCLVSFGITAKSKNDVTIAK